MLPGRLCVNVSAPIKFWMPEPIFIKPGIYHGTSAHFSGVLHKSCPSVCIHTCITFSLLRTGSVKIRPSLLSNGTTEALPWQWIHRQQNNCWTVALYAVRIIVSKESRRLVLPRTSCSTSHRADLFGGRLKPPVVRIPEVKRGVVGGSEADHSPPSSADVRNAEAIPLLPYTSSLSGA
jgi:hypothetical protein